jgi:uncharacterized protein (TIGR03437 family)
VLHSYTKHFTAIQAPPPVHRDRASHVNYNLGSAQGRVPPVRGLEKSPRVTKNDDMRSRRVALLGGLLLGAGAFAQNNFDVGGGAPSSEATQAFVDAWLRNGFPGITGPPLGNVSKFGPTGLIQEFPSTVDSSLILALVSATSTGKVLVWQVLGTMWAYYSAVTEGTAGYPTYDTQNCPALITNPNGVCTWQMFSSNYLLFAYTTGVLATSPLNLATRDPFYTKWNAAGGIGMLGPAIAPELSVTSRFNSNATMQQFDQGAIYSITSGPLNGRVVAIPSAVWNVYFLNGADQGSLGLPEDDLRLLSNGLYQQDFEGGAIQYDPTTGVAQLKPAVYIVTLTPTGSVHMNVGDTLMAQATPMSGAGVALTDRIVGWNTSNSQAVQIQANGLTATLKATGGGTAIITATVEGKISPPLTISVTAPCCMIGEGVPTSAAQKAFQAAVTTAGLLVQVPAATPAVRAGSGYVQTLTGTASPAASYLVTLADSASGQPGLTAYFVSGPILTQYMAMGGPAGSLGYPLANATAGGRQNFQNGALAGNPVQLVSGAILTEWGSLGYESGPTGSPTGAAAPFQTFRGTSGLSQTFQSGLIVTATGGSLAGQSYWVSGLVLAQYNAAGGPGGNLGAPTNNEHNSGALRWQDFEGGYINYMPGAAQATVTISPRQPLVTVSPATVVSGGTVHLIAAGFKNGAIVRVSQTGQPDFQVTMPSGAYSWDVVVSSAAASGTVSITAADSAGGDSAQASYAVRSASTAALTIVVSDGDQQTGAPGALLPEPLVILVQDSSGNPVSGQTVNFAASPGASITPVTAVTGPDGKASAVLRMPGNAGVALATAGVARQVATFSARSAAFSLANFTSLSQNVSGMIGKGSDPILQKGALLTAAASVLRYYQSAGAMPEPNGLADPVTLNQFLTAFCVQGSQGGTQVCDGFVTLGANTDQTVNLWRLAAFVTNDVDVSVEATDLNSLRDLVFSGSPVLLALSLNGQGSHFVTAMGISPAGDLVIADPNPAFRQTLLGAYLYGFTDTGGNMVQGTLAGAVRLLPRSPSASAFLVAATAPLAVGSVNGACGATFQFPDTAAASGVTPASPPGTLYFRACAGLDQGPYQLDVSAQAAYAGTFTVLAAANASASPLTGTAASSSLVVRSGSQWTLSPVTLSIAPSGVINAASFNAQIAPGGLISIFGTGLAPAGSTPVVQVNGVTASVLAAFPFQINAQVPANAAPGSTTISVNLGNGASSNAQQTVSISAVAPAIFSIGASQAAITNQDNTLNTPANPALRGNAIVIYATGFGAVAPSGALNIAQTPVTAVIGATETPTAFAGLTPGFIGLYQANVVVPANSPPGLALPLYLKQGGAVSNTVSVAIQ